MPFAVGTKNDMLNAVVFDRIRLHSGAPGASGTDNALGAGLSAATFATSTTASRALSSAVLVTGLDANQSVTHFSVWTNSGTVFRGSEAITSGDTTANSAGEFSLAVGTTLTLSDS